MSAFPTPLMTRSRLQAALSAAGVAHGDTLCVHAAMRGLGYICGGARTVIDGLLDSLGPTGTLMMPSYTRDTADPREWRYPPAPAEWLNELVAETPAYDPRRTPTQRMGAVAELFRSFPEVHRSNHPISSVAALGPLARALTDGVTLDNRFGEDSPYGRLTRLKGKVAMLGAPYETMSLLHLSQYRVGWGERVTKSACMLVDGKRQWVTFEDFTFPHSWAESCVNAMIESGLALHHTIGQTHLVVVDAAAAVDFTVAWRQKNQC